MTPTLTARERVGRHRESRYEKSGYHICVECHQQWPCDAAGLWAALVAAERALDIVAENEFVDTEIGMVCIVCQRDPERLRTGVHEPDCWLDAALEARR